MKASVAAAIAAAANTVHAAVSYSTITTQVCTTLAPESTMMPGSGEGGTETDTMTTTMTYCTHPACTGMVHTTVWTTAWSIWCPTATASGENYMTLQTYTITETCTGPTPTWAPTPAPDYLPSGYTAVTEACTVCGTASPTAVVTQPASGNAFATAVPPPAANPAPQPTQAPSWSATGGAAPNPGPETAQTMSSASPESSAVSPMGGAPPEWKSTQVPETSSAAGEAISATEPMAGTTPSAMTSPMSPVQTESAASPATTWVGSAMPSPSIQQFTGVGHSSLQNISNLFAAFVAITVAAIFV